MPIRQAIAELLDEVRMTRRALQGLRRDLKRRHDAEQAERQAGEVVAFPHPRGSIKNRG